MMALLAAARAAKNEVGQLSTQRKNEALLVMADALEAEQAAILAANAQDLEAAQGHIGNVMLDRLRLTPARVAAMARGIRDVAKLPDPVGRVLEETVRPNGLKIQKVSVPMGVIAIIYESRPNVTSDAAALALKSGNVCILRGGKEAFRSNQALMSIMRDAVDAAGLPRDSLALVQDTSRDSARELMELTDYLDVLIPRGGAGLIRSVTANAKVPVIRTGEGVCHIYVDAEADLDMAVRVLYNAKCSRPAVCNAAECVLVSRAVAQRFLPMAKAALDEKNVELRGCPETCAILGAGAVPATDEDWDSEYGDYILAVKVVSGVDEAMEFIADHGTRHSESILTENAQTAKRFLDGVDAAAVYHNASTRFTDGFEFGLGAEIGISTQTLHARGPMGLEELTSYKYVVYGSGQTRG